MCRSGLRSNSGMKAKLIPSVVNPTKPQMPRYRSRASDTSTGTHVDTSSCGSSPGLAGAPTGRGNRAASDMVTASTNTVTMNDRSMWLGQKGIPSPARSASARISSRLATALSRRCALVSSTPGGGAMPRRRTSVKWYASSARDAHGSTITWIEKNRLSVAPETITSPMRASARMLPPMGKLAIATSTSVTVQ